jgi:formiminotetrahydrofolate cyclodeaminase
VPGSGSANALAAALAACLAASVAVKTYKSPGTKYIQVQQTARDVERRATRLIERLWDLFEEDSAAFAPVIALRRETGRLSDRLRQDAAVRAEIGALKTATQIPLQIATLAFEAGQLAIAMLDSGYAAARGESYTALAQAIAAIRGAVYVAQMNIRTVRRRVEKLNDPVLEADWLARMLRDVDVAKQNERELRLREHLAWNAAADEIAASRSLS